MTQSVLDRLVEGLVNTLRPEIDAMKARDYYGDPKAKPRQFQGVKARKSK